MLAVFKDVVVSCRAPGGLWLKAGAQEFIAAVGWFERACDSDHFDSCYALGMMYHKGLGVRLSPDEAREFYTKACEGGLKKACLKKQKMY